MPLARSSVRLLVTKPVLPLAAAFLVSTAAEPSSRWPTVTVLKVVANKLEPSTSLTVGPVATLASSKASFCSPTPLTGPAVSNTAPPALLEAVAGAPTGAADTGAAEMGVLAIGPATITAGAGLITPAALNVLPDVVGVRAAAAPVGATARTGLALGVGGVSIAVVLARAK